MMTSCPGWTLSAVLFWAVLPSPFTLKASDVPAPPVPTSTKMPNAAATTAMFFDAETPLLLTVTMAGPSGVMEGRIAATSFGAT